MYPTIVESLKSWATLQPDKKVWTFLGDKEEVLDSFTYKELLSSANYLAYHLLDSGRIKVGDRILLVFFPGLQFMISLLACFIAGFIAVPVFPPDPRKLKKDLHHFISIQSSSGARVVLTHGLYNFAKKVTAIGSLFSKSGVTWPELQWISVDDVIVRGKRTEVDERPSTIKPDDVAFLQYTSGSTSEPKGVMITHKNLAHNETLISREIKSTVSTVNISWLPQYHDMGLIGSYLGVIYCGGTGYYLSPISYLKDPLIWLRTISRYGGTHSQAPNFAFALCTRKFNELHSSAESVMGSNFSLHTLQHCINAAEPIDYKTVQSFVDCFRKYGMTKPSVIVPTYGLAEHTVFVCSGGSQRVWVNKAALEKGLVEIARCANADDELPPAPDTTATSRAAEQELVCIVGCGYPTHGEGVDLVIANSDTGGLCAENEVGEIWVNSPSKAAGYFGLEELTRRDFHATLTGVVESSQFDRSTEFLRTGDLGFMYKSEVFICGRQKDLIIVRGSNHYPQDIEKTSEKVIADIVRPGCSAAFSVKKDDQPDTELVVYVAEMKDEKTPLAAMKSAVENIKEAVSGTHGVSLATIYLLKPRTIPKTTSGKIARSWCRRGYNNDTLEVLFKYHNPNSDVVMPLSEESVGDNGDSIEMTSNSRANPGNAVSTRKFTEQEIKTLSPAQLIKQLEELLGQIASNSPAGAEALSQSVPGGIANSALTMLGLDSMTVAQFKGVLEKRYHFNAPDDFMFTEMATLSAIALIIQRGGLTDQQQEWLENGIPEGALSTDANTDMGQPMCPWCTCWY